MSTDEPTQSSTAISTQPAIGESTSAPFPEDPHPGHEPEPQRKKLNLGLDRFSGLYVWAAAIVLFGLWVPDTFLTADNFRIIAGDQAITGMLALGLIVPLAAGVFDLSFAAVMAFAVCLTLYVQAHGHSVLLSIVAGVGAGVVIGALNGFVVVRLHVSSFIATLGMSSIGLALAVWLTGGQQIVLGVSPKFVDFGSKTFLSLPLYFYVMMLLAAVLYVVLEHTTVGRYLYACGGNPQAARLSGVRVDRILVMSLVASSSVAALTGVVLAAKLGTADYSVGGSYLLPAFSAVFLGSTQIKAGRVNVLGTLVAIYLLATGVKGLQLAGAQAYVNDLFNGLALIIAVALSARTAHKS